MKQLIRLLSINLFILFSYQAYAGGMEFSDCQTRECEEAFKEFQGLAIKGIPQAQMILAGMYYSGYGVEKSSKNSLRWYKEAGRKGSSFARYRSGLLYLFDQNIEKNVSKGLKLLKGAAKDDNSEAAYTLADIYIQGTLVPTDMKQAEKWLLIGSNLNHANSQYRLGLIYESGILGKKELNKAIALYQNAAKTNELASLRLSVLTNKEMQATDNDNIERIAVSSPDFSNVLDSVLSNIKQTNDLRKSWDYDSFYALYSYSESNAIHNPKR